MKPLSSEFLQSVIVSAIGIIAALQLLPACKTGDVAPWVVIATLVAPLLLAMNAVKALFPRM